MPTTSSRKALAWPAPRTHPCLNPSPLLRCSAPLQDCQLVFSIEIRGSYIVPFTSPKATVIARVLRDRYLRSAQLPDISVASLNSFTVGGKGGCTSVCVNKEGGRGGGGCHRSFVSIAC